jgi:hypothetical protein
MFKIIAIFKAIGDLLPAIIAFVMQLEAAMPEKDQGSIKRELLREVLKAAFETTKDGQITFDEIWPLVEKTIGLLVTAFKTTGVFKK